MRLNQVDASQKLTVPIPEHGLSENVLGDDPRLGVGLSGDSLKVPLIRCCLVGDIGSVNCPFNSYEGARETLHSSIKATSPPSLKVTSSWLAIQAASSWSISLADLPTASAS